MHREGLGLLRSVDRYPLTWRTDPIKGTDEVGGVGRIGTFCLSILMREKSGEEELVQ